MAKREIMPTASRMPDILTLDGKLRATKAVNDYALQLAYCQLKPGRPRWTQGGSAATEHGINNEMWALREYATRNYRILESSVFLSRVVDGCFFGGTPDAIVSGCPVEVKNPWNGTNHLATIIRNTVPDNYYAQVQTQILVMDAPHAIFISADPDLDDPYDVYAIKVERNETFEANFFSSLKVFTGMVEQIIERIKINIK